MKLSFVFNRTKNLFLNSKTEWQAILKETHSKELILKNYAIPLILILVICSFFGSIFMVSKFWYAMLKAIGLFASAYVGTYMSAVIINEITSSFNIPKNLDTIFALVVYSSTASIVMSSLVLLWPPLALLSVFGLYSVYLYWTGSSVLLNISKDDKLSFVVISCLIVIGVFTILWLILGGILTTVFEVSILK